MGEARTWRKTKRSTINLRKTIKGGGPFKKEKSGRRGGKFQEVGTD